MSKKEKNITQEKNEEIKNENIVEEESLSLEDEDQNVGQEENISSTVSFKEVFKPLLKLFLIPLIFVICGLSLFIGMQIYSSSFKSHFIAPTKEDIYGQKEDMYLLSTYYQYDKNSIAFIKEIKQMAKSLNIGYYMIDIEKYPEVINSWQITKSPSYYLVDKTEEEIIYASYGKKDDSALAIEINNVMKYGLPQNDVNLSQSIKDGSESVMTVTLTEIAEVESVEGRYKVTFNFKNNSSNDININASDFKATYNPFDNEKSLDNLEYNLVDVFERVTIASGEEKEITLYYNEFENKDFRISIKYSYKDSDYYWNYKLWP